MKDVLALFIFSTLTLTSLGQDLKYPGRLEIRGYKIGDKVERKHFKKIGNVYFPNYLDGWSMENHDKLPEKYKGLPIAIWQLKSDSSIVLTLLNDVILNITVSYMSEGEKEEISKMITEKIGSKGIEKSHKKTHPLQSWVTYWNLKTWETNDIVIQIGNGDMRQPNDPIPSDLRWNLVYSDFILEKKIINDFRKK